MTKPKLKEKGTKFFILQINLELNERLNGMNGKQMTGSSTATPFLISHILHRPFDVHVVLRRSRSQF